MTCAGKKLQPEAVTERDIERLPWTGSVRGDYVSWKVCGLGSGWGKHQRVCHCIIQGTDDGGVIETTDAAT